ncbi:hypothetical protein BABINDRAFT_163315 [Babjeviella inositovora NRRL Y-12698]|uniref:Chitin biosynthesis protein CHS5 n=1 Tax=Babjeviella inositovora NRRL Y-12698 TaxID=984486 RepID=A0A1E3QIR3_9ASCO|nr:uncharacterized protein BABINDRAFT_163315 [Babjeviella inositovora NRRL Y-12698]ODQ77581.1 hypothetical protein BABINDRAFT_163315 [Babjeviella inositovora NRRL Y-12698]
MIEVSLTVAKLDASLALLLTDDHHLIEFPTILLPNGVVAGSIVKINVNRDLELEATEAAEFSRIQDEILMTFGSNEPQAPVLRVKNITQTSTVLEWESLDLGSASIKSLTLFKDGIRLGNIPSPLVTTTTKLSGLSIEQTYKFQLRMDTTSGIYMSEPVELTMHKMTDLSGITVCVGDLAPEDGITRKDIEEVLAKMGAKPVQDNVKVDTTHFVCTVGKGKQWQRANDGNIPIVRPEWLKACELERRLVGVRGFYLDADLAAIKERYEWKKEVPGNTQRSSQEEEEFDNASVAAIASSRDLSTTKPEEDSPLGESTMHEDADVTVDETNGVNGNDKSLPLAPAEESNAELSPVPELPVEEANGNTLTEEPTQSATDETEAGEETSEPVEKSVDSESSQPDKGPHDLELVSLTSEPVEMPAVLAAESVEEKLESVSLETPEQDLSTEVDTSVIQEAAKDEVNETEDVDGEDTDATPTPEQTNTSAKKKKKNKKGKK